MVKQHDNRMIDETLERRLGVVLKERKGNLDVVRESPLASDLPTLQHESLPVVRSVSRSQEIASLDDHSGSLTRTPRAALILLRLKIDYLSHGSSMPRASYAALSQYSGDTILISRAWRVRGPAFIYYFQRN